jgi:hypothetical protein
MQQPTGSYGIVTSEVMKRSCYLNQPLQERLIRLMRFQPYNFPRFMRREVFASVVTTQAFRKCALSPVELHLSRLSYNKVASYRG